MTDPLPTSRRGQLERDLGLTEWSKYPLSVLEAVCEIVKNNDLATFLLGRLVRSHEAADRNRAGEIMRDALERAGGRAAKAAIDIGIGVSTWRLYTQILGDDSLRGERR